MLPLLSTVVQFAYQLTGIEVWRLARHPLTILLIGAAFSSVLVPRKTRQWQDRRRNEEIKTLLVTEVADCVMSLLVRIEGFRSMRNTAELAHANAAPVAGDADTGERPKSASRFSRLRRRLRGMLVQRDSKSALAERESPSAKAFDKMNDAYQEFVVREAVIGTKLEAYCQGSSLPEEWTRYSRDLTLLYRLEDSDRQSREIALLSERTQEWPLGPTERKQAVASAAARCGGIDQEWCQLEELFLVEKRRLILRIRSVDLRT